jgi:hypothetical protein
MSSRVEGTDGEVEMALQSALDLLLALLVARGTSGNENEPIRDSTRLVKLVFLLIKEGGFERFDEEFGFKKDYAHDFGPWSSQVYDYVETLKQIKFLNTQDVAKQEPEEGIDDAEWARQFPDPALRQSGTIVVYQLTDTGLKVAKKIFATLSDDDKDKIIRVKARFNSTPLSQLLEYVYRRYPEGITKSKIREKVLARSMFGVSPELPKFEREEEEFRDIE